MHRNLYSFCIFILFIIGMMFTMVIASEYFDNIGIPVVSAANNVEDEVDIDVTAENILENMQRNSEMMEDEINREFVIDKGHIFVLISLQNKKEREKNAVSDYVAEQKRIEEEKRIVEEKRLEEERIAEEKRLEEERIAEEKRLEAERLAEEKRLEAERLAEEKRLESERLVEERRIFEEKEQVKEEKQDETIKSDENTEIINNPDGKFTDFEYVGYITIDAVNVKVDCYLGSKQVIVDRDNSAAYFQLGDQHVVADHRNQGFEKIKLCNTGDILRLYKVDGAVIEYTCVKLFLGHNTQHALTDWDGNSIRTEYNTNGMTLYTCNENSRNVTIVFFQPVNPVIEDVQEQEEIVDEEIPLEEKPQDVVSDEPVEDTTEEVKEWYDYEWPDLEDPDLEG